MQHHDGRRVGGLRADHAVFEFGGADGEEAGGGEGCHQTGFPKCGMSNSLRHPGERRDHTAIYR